MSQAASVNPARHYDRITRAWCLLLGDDLHYGVFTTGRESLEEATAALTALMVEKVRVEPGLEILDVGCGTGTQACRLAEDERACVTGITTSSVGVQISRERARQLGVSRNTRFEARDGTDNAFADQSFDRVWILESSHLMRQRDRLLSESARVLRHSGTLALCDIVLRRPMSLADVRRLRDPLSMLREVFGDARMEPLERYVALAEQCGLQVQEQLDLTSATRPTFSRWRDNADRYREQVVALLGERDWRRFVDSCAVLERFWDDGTLGYGLLVADKP